MRKTPWTAPVLALMAMGLVVGCDTIAANTRTPGQDEYSGQSRRDQMRSRLGNGDGLLIVGTERSNRAGADQGGGGIGVNAYLWRATLDTLSFMPLASADPFGGVVITDWHSPPAAGGERFRATAYILGRQLRSDGVRVVVFRQEQRAGNWVDVAVSASTNSELEDKVLARARELRSQSASN